LQLRNAHSSAKNIILWENGEVLSHFPPGGGTTTFTNPANKGSRGTIPYSSSGLKYPFSSSFSASKCKGFSTRRFLKILKKDFFAGVWMLVSGQIALYGKE
jgi:hypothetical protein